MSSGSGHSAERDFSITSHPKPQCDANKKAVGPAVPMLPIDFFLEHILPSLHASFTDANFESIFRRLKRKPRGKISAPYDVRTQRWTAFNGISLCNEQNTYAALAVVAKDIIKAVSASVKPVPVRLFDFHNDGTHVPQSTFRDSLHKPDGYFILRGKHRQRHGQPHWMNIGPTGEYQWDDSRKSVEDDFEKMFWTITHIMRDDARRRFAFAFTIKKMTMRLWCATRSEILMSSSFDFMKEPKHLLRFFVSFLYATEAACGWDPTVKCLWEGQKLQYLITVRDEDNNEQTYKTVELLSNIGADALRGRGTRVWRAVPYGTKKNPATSTAEVVIKDCWVDHSLRREGHTIQRIITQAESMVKTSQQVSHNTSSESDSDANDFTQEDLDTLKQRLLTIEIHGDVSWVDKSGEVVFDKTLPRDVLFPDGDIPYHYLWVDDALLDGKSEAQHSQHQEQLKDEHRSVYLCIAGRSEPVMYNPKAHYRIVFKEVCRTIKDERFLYKIFGQLAQTCQALRVLHRVGWVHRDISAGNILIFGDNTVKLADFEYAKDTKEHSENHDIRTGTADFMAVEVHDGDFHFRTPEVAEQNLHAQSKFDFRMPDELEQAGEPPRASEDPAAADMEMEPIPWFYNPLHDMESVWWLGDFFTLNKDVEFVSKKDHKSIVDDASLRVKARGSNEEVPIPLESEATRANRIQEQEKFARTLFYGSSGRLEALVSDDGIKSFVHPALREVRIVHYLLTIRYALVERYRAVEATLVEGSYQVDVGNLHAQMTTVFLNACNHLYNDISALAVVKDLSRERIVSRITQQIAEVTITEQQAELPTPAQPLTKKVAAKKKQNDPTPPTRTQPTRQTKTRPPI